MTSNTAWATHMTFQPDTSINDRVEAIAPVVNAMCEAFVAGDVKDGVQFFQDMVISKIRAAELLTDDMWTQVDNVGVHPDNREGCGLVPIDVHDLLKRIVNDGWSYHEVDALACEVPPNEQGNEWRSFNERLYEASNGLLAAIKGSYINIVTARGSHTTAACRILKFGAKGVHEELAGADGRVSKAKIVEMRPSMESPLQRGLGYTVVKWQLVVACPLLMKVLARTGNVSHGAHRIATALQGCIGLHQAYVATKDWAQAITSASQGQQPEFRKDVEHFKAFIEAHSGGDDAKYLKALEAYERQLTVKRQIRPSDLGKLANVSLPAPPRYVPAMTKALLNAPSCKVQHA